MQLGGGKPIAMGEVGQLPKDLAVFEEQPDWTWFMVWGYFIGGHRSGRTIWTSCAAFTTLRAS